MWVGAGGGRQGGGTVKGGRGGGGGEGCGYAELCTVTTRMISALRQAATRAILMPHSL